jgi:predicted alpha/beta-hydrolase family hydrolase
MPTAERLTLDVSPEQSVSALWCVPTAAQSCLVLGHGAGAGMEHASMQALADALAEQRVASLRYQFPYMERGSRRPDPPPLCHATVRAAASRAHALLPDTPLFAGGRSFGGRMTSQAQAIEPLTAVRGVVFFAFPLHPADEPSITRAAHLNKIAVPMLFLQGTKDKLAAPELLASVVAQLARATLHAIDDADHSFHVPARSGRTDAQVLQSVVLYCAHWMTSAAAK